ncbi:MAG: flavin monoamine oxidase family protein [Stellaceae bacterium]
MAVDLSRRSFINLAGRAGSVTGLYATLGAMGLLPSPSVYAQPPRLPAASGRGVRVVILGAGIAGMTAGYQLRQAGYDCVILEARERSGGRVWTLRAGDRVVETESEQHVAWDEHPDLYFNAGAARLSQHHQGILHYCREFGVRLEPFVIDNRAALLQNDAVFDGKPLPIRRIVADSRGAVAALAATAPAAHDPALGGFVRAFGDLQPDMTYTGSARAGYATAPGAGSQAGELYPPLALDEIAKSADDEAMKAGIFLPELWDYSPAMLQPVGGMDAIPRAFARALGATIRHHAEIVALRRVGERARVIWRDRRSGRKSAIDAEIVICTIPLPVLSAIDADFTAPVKRAIDAGAGCYIPAVKVAFQSNRRWWETDLRLFGGISWTTRDITQMWYPSHGFCGTKGILVGAYIWSGDSGDRFASMPPAERNKAAIASGERLHPGYASRVARGVSIAWSKIPFSLGGWIEWTDAARQEAYPVLLAGDGPFYFAGEHMSYVNGWQEGAVQSAHYTVMQIKQRDGVRRKA